MDATDVLDDAAQALALAGVDTALIRRVLISVRARWVGPVYIRQRDQLAELEIRDALESGQKPREVAQRVGVSERTIRRRRSEWFK